MIRFESLKHHSLSMQSAKQGQDKKQNVAESEADLSNDQ